MAEFSSADPVEIDTRDFYKIQNLLELVIKHKLQKVFSVFAPTEESNESVLVGMAAQMV